MFIVYLIYNLRNMKYYVGWSSFDFSTRWKWHVTCAESGEDWLLSRAIRKYGLEFFSHEILAVVSSKEEATTLEKLWIIILRAYDPKIGYNMTFGGDGGKPTEITRSRISNGLKEGYRSGRIKIWNKGIPATEEFKKRMSIAKKGKCSEKLLIHLAKLVEKQTGRPSGAKGTKRNPKQIEVLRLLNKGKKHSIETRSRMSLIRKAWWSSKKSTIGDYQVAVS